MQFAGFIGQIDTAADNLDAVIYGLLAVAFLLTILTIWYWRHTKPRPLVVGSAGNASPSAGEPALPIDDDSVLERALDDSFDPDSVWADAPATPSVTTTTPTTGFASEPEVAPIEPMSADEWLAITGPDEAPALAPNPTDDSTAT